VPELLDMTTDTPDPSAGAGAAPKDLAALALGRGEPTSVRRSRHEHEIYEALAASPHPRKPDEQARRRRLLGPERDGLHAAGEAGLLLRRRDRRRRRRGLLPLQGLQARPRLHGPPGMRPAPSSALRLDLRFLRAYRNYFLGGTHQARESGVQVEWGSGIECQFRLLDAR
jgi:hypothetical protein